MRGTERKICLKCDKDFLAYTTMQKFCSRKCFKQHDYSQDKEDEKTAEFPKYVCPECRASCQLDFFPIQDMRRWMEFQCPGCEKQNNNTMYNTEKKTP